MAIWRDLVDDHGFPGQYASVRRFVRRLRGARATEAHPLIITAPGEEGQVDYGDGPMVRHPITRKYRRTRLFVFTLGYSRKSIRLLTFTSSTRRWAELHEEAFRRLGGSVPIIVLDNLREGVLKPDIYDPTLNPLYRDVLAHYGAVALPCRVGDPDRKGKVESAIGHTQTALKGLRFETLDDAQSYLDRWDARWANTRIHGTTKRQVATMFAEERGPACGRCPSSHFATTSSDAAPYISTTASRSMPATTAPRPAGSARKSPCSGTPATSVCSIPAPANCCANTAATPGAAATPSTPRIGRRARRRAR
jgi:transposase